MANLTAEQKAFFDREWGGFDKYVAGQRGRFLNAANSTPSDLVTMQKKLKMKPIDSVTLCPVS